MGIIPVVFLAMFLAAHILLFILQFVGLKWDLVNEKGMAITLIVWGGYRKSPLQQFVKPEKLSLFVLLDKVRICSFMACICTYVIILLISLF
ncbi:hypothetical protein Maes01_01814 [Microbulbifer aestuariivivens]|uniref:Uncharacterized protein n=1 Tax=Microbulbifer aestuariivivens TaxID=1908308 RepID=A0ABP9WQF6_9GAMM